MSQAIPEPTPAQPGGVSLSNRSHIFHLTSFLSSLSFLPHADTRKPGPASFDFRHIFFRPCAATDHKNMRRSAVREDFEGVH